MEIPAPPEGFRVATSTYEVYEACNRTGRDEVLRIYVDRTWTPGRLDIAISSVPRRPTTRNVPVTWGEALTDRRSRRMPIERIAVPVKKES